MNIALFASAFYPHFGGVEELVRQLALELKRRCHTVIVLTNRWPRSLPARDIHDGIPLYRLPFRMPEMGVKAKVNYLLTNRRVKSSVLGILRRHRIDILHVQCVSSNAHYAMFARDRLGLPLVVTLQGELTMDAQQIFQKSALARRTLRTALETADAVTGCSTQTLNDAEEFFGTKITVPRHTIFNGARVDDFAAAEPFSRDRPYLFAIGRMVPQKGFDVLIRAFAASGVPSHDLLIAGDGPELDSLKQLVNSLNLGSRVMFLGRKDRQEVPRLFRGCSFFILPSRAHEGLPVVCAEAMAAGKAVIATRSGGTPEAVIHGETGLIVDRENGEGLAQAITSLCQDKSLRDQYAMAGKKRSERFSWPVITDQYEALYGSLLGLHRNEHSRTAGDSTSAAGPLKTPPYKVYCADVRRDRSLCVISETVGEENAIGKVAMAQVKIALRLGFKVSIVAKQLSPSLRQDVEWLRLTVPPRIFLLKWVTARAFMKAALGGRHFDLIHAHQPQAASLADVFTCHFLTRVAFERKALEPLRTLRSAVNRAQQQAVLHVEDHFYRRWNSDTQMLFCSDMLREEFERLYGAPQGAQVMINPSPPDAPVAPEDRRDARLRFLGGEVASPVIGYLGGFQERKGFRRLIDAVQKLPSATLLIGGPNTQSDNSQNSSGKMRVVGNVRDVENFYAACDIIAVPSLFDPCPLVVLEAAARRIPVIATDGVGNLPQLLQYGAGLRWDGVSPLEPLVSAILNERATFETGASRMTAALSAANHGNSLCDVYEKVLARKLGGVNSATAAVQEPVTCPGIH